jgi:CDP-diacylglycerol--glycerol-3-phosphate 3-phosphatidyltransferase
VVNHTGGASDFDFEASLKPPLPASMPKIVKLDRIINRPIAAWIVRAAIRFNLRPNHLTVAAFVLSAAGALFFLGGNRHSFIVAGLLMYAGTLFDAADGMLARAQKLCTRFGAYLDLYLDRVTDFLVFGAMAVGYYRQSGRLGFFILSLVGFAAYMLQVLLYYLEREYRGIQSSSGASGDFRGLVYLGILFFSLIGRLDLVIAILICIPVLNMVYRFIRFWIIERPEEPPPRTT